MHVLIFIIVSYQNMMHRGTKTQMQIVLCWWTLSSFHYQIKVVSFITKWCEGQAKYCYVIHFNITKYYYTKRASHTDTLHRPSCSCILRLSRKIRGFKIMALTSCSINISSTEKMYQDVTELDAVVLVMDISIWSPYPSGILLLFGCCSNSVSLRWTDTSVKFVFLNRL